MTELASTMISAGFPALLGVASPEQIPAAVAAPELSWAGLILLLPAVSAVLCGVCAVLGV